MEFQHETDEELLYISQLIQLIEMNLFRAMNLMLENMHGMNSA